MLITSGMGAWWYGRRILFEQEQIATSDAVGHIEHLRIAGDHQPGYWFLHSPQMKARQARSGQAIDFTTSHGDYAAQLQSLVDGTQDALVMPVESYLKYGSGFDYPGVIVASLYGPRTAQPDAHPTAQQQTSDAHVEVIQTSTNAIEVPTLTVLVVNRETVSQKPGQVKLLLKNYFQTLDYYTGHRDEFVQALVQETEMTPQEVEKFLARTDWYDLRENSYELFGVSRNPAEGQPNKLVSTLVQRNSSVDPYRLINSNFLRELLNSEATTFTALTEEAWAQLTTTTVLDAAPVIFQRSTDELDYEDEVLIDQVAERVKQEYPGYRLIVRGHTGLGDEAANLILSQRRAEKVRAQLISRGRLDANQLHAEGVGATQPPTRQADESERAYRLRMPRVEFILAQANPL